MRLVVLGAPGAGKGTQARNLASYYNIAHISTGDMLRVQIRLKTEIGKSISELIEKGQLVPDALIEQLVRERILEKDCENGFILDGFPRNRRQAEVFDVILKEVKQKLDNVIHVQVEDEVIVDRISGRLSCPNCGKMYHKTAYPSKDGILCDECGVVLVQRKDDNAETVRERLEIYHNETEPLIAYYKAESNLVEINGVGEMQEITDKIVKMLGGKN